MKAMTCLALGEPATWAWQDHEPPSLGPGDVRVQIRAAGVNFPDLLASRGEYHMPTPPPYVPGLEAAGDVIQVGADVTEFSPGDRVIIDGSSDLVGLFAEECVVDAGLVFPLPDAIDYAQGAAFPVVYATGYHGLVQRGGLERGETLVVHGASGGVGLAAMQIGRALGARVIGTVGSVAKAEALNALGWDEIIVVGDDLRDRLLDATDGKGADCYYDPVGGAVFEASMRAVAKLGRLLVIGAASGTYVPVKTNHVLVKEVSVTGVLYGAWKARFPDRASENMAALSKLAAAGDIAPVIWKSIPMSEADTALAALGNREVVGKIVVTPEAA